MTDNATVVREDLRNTGGDKYETTAREIQICRFSTFCSKWRMTFRKVTPAALKVNVKKFWQVLLVPWHVWAPIWVHFAPWWSIFPVKNRFSHIFPAPEGSPYQSLFLRYEIEKGLRAVYTGPQSHKASPSQPVTRMKILQNIEKTLLERQRVRDEETDRLRSNGGSLKFLYKSTRATLKEVAVGGTANTNEK